MREDKKYLPYAAGITVAVIFGFSFLFTKRAIDIMDPMQIITYRFTLAALLMSILRRLKVIRVDFKGKNMRNLALLALAQPVSYFIFETLGIKMTSSSETGMMIALIPIVVTILAAIFLKEKPSFLQVIFILVSVSGVIFITLAKGALSGDSSYLGFLVLFLAVVTSAIYNVLSRKLSTEYKPVEITYFMMWSGAVAFNAIEIVRRIINGNIMDYYAPLANVNSWVPVLYLGVLSSVCAFFMVNYMLSKVPAHQSSVIANVSTVISIGAGVFIAGEPFYWFQAVGGAMIILGVWGTNYYGIKEALRPKAKPEKIPA